MSKTSSGCLVSDSSDNFFSSLQWKLIKIFKLTSSEARDRAAWTSNSHGPTQCPKMQLTREIFMKPWRFSLPFIIVVWHRRNLIEFQRKNSKTLTNIYCSDCLQFLRSGSSTDRGKFEALSAFKIKITKTKRNFTEVLQKRCEGSSRARRVGKSLICPEV